MITNIHRAKTASDIQRYVRYTLAPKEEKENQHYQAGERLLDIDTQYISIGPDVEHNATSHDITNQIMDWNKEHRPGKKAPACPALLGEFSFTKADKEQFYTESHTGERYLDTRKILAVCKRGIGMTMSDDRPMFLSLHGDTECLHVHFAAAMVNSHGKIWDGSTLTDEHGNKTKVRDYRQWELTNEKLEIEYGLERVQHRKAMMHEGEHRQSQVKRPSNAEVHLLKDKGILSDSMDLAGRLDEAYNKSNKQFDKFLELTEQYRIRIKPNMSATKVNGLSFAIDDMDGFIKASDLGNKYKWSKLEKELNYEHSRDFQKLAGLKDRESANRPVVETSINTASELTRITEELTRVTEELTETVRIEQGANIADNGIGPSIGHEDRNELARPSSVSKEATGQRTSNRENGRSENTSTTSTDNRHIAASLDSVGGSPSYQPSTSIRYVESVEQSIKSATDDNSRNGFNEQTVGQTGAGHSDEQPVATVDLQEDKVKRRERSITNLITKGGMTREQAEFAYEKEQQLAAKRAEEPTWTPDKPVTKEPDISDMSRRLAEYAKQMNTQNRSRSSGYSNDSGLSI